MAKQKKKRAIPVKSDPAYQSQMTLPGFEDVIKSPDMLAEKYISDLQENGWVEYNILYLQNYVNSNPAIAFSNIKSAYIKYVTEELWSEEKFTNVLTYITTRRSNFLSIHTFSKFGKLYDEGKLEEKSNTKKKEIKEVSSSLQEKVYSDDELLAALFEDEDDEDDFFGEGLLDE